ncbi:MAG: PQQ-binding-like beta-propeller repeat protein [Haloarculaceae archaeon]
MATNDKAGGDAGNAVHEQQTNNSDLFVSKPGDSTIKRTNVDAIPQVDVTQQDLYDSADDPTSWLLYGNGYRNHHHTTADVIKPDTLNNLDKEWEVHVGEVGGDFQGSPLVVPGDPPIIYQSNGPDNIRAMNARTGEVLWTHVYHPVTDYLDQKPSAHRGVAVPGDTLYTSTLDLGVLALDRYDASEQWYYNGAYQYRDMEASGDPQTAIQNQLHFLRHTGYSSSYPPVVYEGTMAHGSFGGEYGVRGWIEGVTTDGEQAWRQYNSPKDQWIGDAWQHAGGTVWQAPAIDPDSGLAVFPVSNPGPWYGTARPGWNPYTSGKVAYDMTDGEYQWHYQVTPHDWWDYDSMSPPFIFEAKVDGEQRKLASWGGKSGWAYTVDAKTGELVQRSEPYTEHLNTYTLPPKNIDDRPPIMPRVLGGTDPQPPAYDPNSQTMVVKGVNQPMKMSWSEIEYQAGKLYTGEEHRPVPADQRDQIDGWDKPLGNVTALDPVSGDILWQDWVPRFPWGGSLTTATGLTFAGLASGNLVAYDTESGDRLWEGDVGPAVDSNPVSWYDPGTNKQYVMVQGGGAHMGEDGNKAVAFAVQE